MTKSNSSAVVSFAYDYRTCIDGRTEFAKGQEKFRIPKRPYFNSEVEAFEEKMFYSKDEIISSGLFSQHIEKRIRSARPGTFIKTSSQMWRGGPNYGFLIVSQKTVEEYQDLEDEISSLAQKSAELDKKLRKTNAIYKDLVETQKNLAKRKKEFKQWKDGHNCGKMY